jgi:hypothetical protein
MQQIIDWFSVRTNSIGSFNVKLAVFIACHDKLTDWFGVA